jgi:YbgC/YbaW family acyl-CoA thioester hydrolase
MIFEYKKRIYGFECDIYGHFNNANYLQLLESARAEAMIDIGMSISRLRELDLQIFVRGFELDYQKAIELEDIVTVKSWYDEMNRLKGTWTQQIFNSRGELCFQATMLGVFARGGKPQRLPQDVFELFLSYAEKDQTS